nr:hypothetical protein Iba_chr08dCG8720 [Ipomoea batatas]
MKVHLAHMSQQQHSLYHSCWFPKVLSDPFAQQHRGQEAKSCRAKGTRLADKTAGDSMQKYILDQESLAYAKWHCVWWTTIQNHLCSGSELSLCQEYSIKTTLTLQEVPSNGSKELMKISQLGADRFQVAVTQTLKPLKLSRFSGIRKTASNRFQNPDRSEKEEKSDCVCLTRDFAYLSIG